MAKISDFSTDKVFRSLEDLKNWVQNIARSQGYVIVTKRLKATTFGFKSKVFLCCDRSGIPRSKNAKTKKFNCPFELIAKYLKAQDGWKLQVVRDDHNHEPSIYMEETRLVHDLTELNVKPLDILSTIKQQNENNVSSLKTIYNCRHKFTISQREGRSPIQNVMHILHTKGYNYEYQELFFMHPISLQMWQAFPHVVLMDATYKTNKSNLPFLEIVGVTSMRLTFSIAFAFMHSEKTSNYMWVLTCLKLTINDSFCPRVIVTDRDLALMKACEDVFPQSNNLLCRKRIKSDKSWGSLHPMWKKLVESPSLSAYMQAYADLQSLFINQIIYIRKMEEIIDPSKIMINEPSVKKNNRGRPKVKRGHHQSQAPHRYSCSDWNQEPPRHSSSFFDLNNEPTRHCSSFFNLNDEATRHNSSFFNLNDEPARHTVCLGYDENEWPFIRQQLYDELLTSYEDYSRVFIGCNGVLDSLSFLMTDRTTPPEHYMLMLETSILIANRFGVIVQLLTTVDPITFFPLWRVEFQNHRVLKFALVYINHYVMVQLEGEYPMPPISALWICHKDPSAAE
uniref:MULE transposase domain-containing protein n=1 Tax=Lactuca sativa TaxID=4236 RepID=A0A9R1V3F4_LACSA|nr:hypothetical protein LSAT_V11C600320760 [Lactuca sativa]